MDGFIKELFKGEPYYLIGSLVIMGVIFLIAGIDYELRRRRMNKK